MYKFSSRSNFYIRLFALFMIFSFLIIDFISAVYYPMAATKDLTYGERVSNYYALFTTESNYLVAIYFATYLYTSYFKKESPNFSIRLAVTVYISITMIIFWTAIFTKSQDPANYSIYNWINTIILHLIMPVSMIASFIITSGHELINIRKWHRNYLFLIAIYPLVYSIVILVRGHLRYLDFVQSGGKHPPESTWFPYFFFNVHQPYGALIGTAAVIFIFGLVFSLQYFYIIINNLLYNRRKPEVERLEQYYSKTLRKLGKRKRLRKNKN